MNTNPLPVTQADREAARAFWDAWDLSCAQGEALVQAFARHRLSASIAPPIEGVELADEPLPVAYYLWLATIEPDVRVRDLTADEAAGLIAALRQSPPVQMGDEELERWADIRDDTDAIVACGERWKAVASVIGCRLHGFNDGRSASFFTPDDRVIEVGPKFRAAIEALSPRMDDERNRALEEAAAWHDAQAANAKLRYEELDRYSDDAEERRGWRSWKDANDRHRSYAVAIRALSSNTRDRR